VKPVSDVLLTTLADALVPPNVTAAPDLNPVPRIVKFVKPLTEPDVGETDVTVTVTDTTKRNSFDGLPTPHAFFARTRT
jgi:hypothetical protein